MSGLSLLMLGFGLGLRHATDADHLVVVSALLRREPGVLRAARVAAFWGAGHTLAFLGIGLLVVLIGIRVPARFEQLAQVAVALMLLSLGVVHLVRAFGATSQERPTPPRVGVFRPLVIGVVHGLAGSAGVALLAASTIRSPTWAAAYLVVFGAGTVLGMLTLTMLLSWPLGWTLRRKGMVPQLVTVLGATLSLLLGAAILFEHGAGAL